MRAVTRLRAYAVLWLLAGLLGAVMVFVVAAAGPTTRGVEDAALRQALADAPMSRRDVVVSEPVEAHRTSAGIMRETVEGLLPPELASVVQTSWGIQRTQTRQPGGNSTGSFASVTGEGIVAEVSDAMPLATLHYQTDLADEITVVEGAAPRTDADADPADRVIEVVVSAGIAESLGLRVGGDYHLLPGVVGREPFPASEAGGPAVPITVTGVFEPRDAAAPAWQFDRQLLEPGVISWVYPDGVVAYRTATFVTDQAGIDTVVDLRLTGRFNPFSLSPESAARVRLDEESIDASQAAGIRDAMAALRTHPELRPDMLVESGLIDLVDEFQRQASAARAVTAVVVAGLVGTGAGLLVLASRVMVDRRRVEMSLLRARGASLLGLAGRFLVEAVLVVVPAVALGWVLHLPLPGRSAPDLVDRVGVAPLTVGAVALLAVPVAVVLATHRQRGAAERRRGTAERRRGTTVPARATAEALVLVLAGVGLLLLHQRGLSLAGTDPYLSAVPVLLGLAAGVVILRCYPWPLRALGAAVTRGRGAVGFLGLTRAGRAVPAAALPLLVLVLAVALGGFTGATYDSVAAARAQAALAAVGADARVTAEEITPEMAAAVSRVPGVREVAEVGRDGFVFAGGTHLQDTLVAAVDTAAYQRILSGLETPVRLPEELVSASPGDEPLPVLASTTLSGRDDLAVRVAGVELPVEVVGDVAGVPVPHLSASWVLVPRQALPEPGPSHELLIGGPQVHADALQEALGGQGEIEVTTRAGRLGELAGSGFNRALTIGLVVGTAGAILGGLLAVGMAVAVQAAARGHTLSLLRTMGLSVSQARGLLLVELVPVTLLAVSGGAVAGAAMPVVLAPALGLTNFTGGVPVAFDLNLTAVGLVAALVSAFVIGGALVEAAANRRLGLARVLRVD